MEVVEIKEHPWFIGCQFHPEFTSTPRAGHPLFSGFVQAARHYHENKFGTVSEPPAKQESNTSDLLEHVDSTNNIKLQN